MVLAWAAPSAAAPFKGGGFSKEELQSILGLLRSSAGLLALSETGADGKLETMTIAVRVNAPREKAFQVFENPENFYYISSLFKENDLLQRHENAMVYTWASRHKFFSFTGQNQVNLFPPRRIDVSIQKSTIGSGHFKFMFYPDGKDHSIVVLAGRLDVNSSEWLIRYLIGGNPAMKQAMNIAIGTVIMKGVKNMAETLYRNKPLKKHRTKGTRTGELVVLKKEEIKALEPLLKRGQVVITSSVKGGRMRQAVVLQEVNAPAPKLIYAAGTPEFYPKMIKSMTEIKVHKKTDTTTDFSWTLGFSVFGIESRNLMSFSKEGIDIKAMTGDLKGASWRWQITPRGPNKALVAYYGYADIAATTYIMKKTVKREPYLEHGFMAGSNMVMVTAIRRAAEKK